MAITNTGIVERTITGVNDGSELFPDNTTSTATNTGIVERSLTGVNESELWLDTESTSVVNNTGIVERPITGVNESDPMFPNNTISNIINLAGNLLIALFEAFKTRVSAGGGTLDNEVGLDTDSFDDTTSLTMLPNAYKDGVLYSVLPEDGTGDFDVVRGSSATRVNAEGLIELVSNNEPRIDYTSGSPVLLTEPQSTNVLSVSEDFNANYWTKSNSPTIANNISSPDGGNNAWEISSTNSSSRIQRISGTLPAGDHTQSIFVKYKDGDVRMNFRNNVFGGSQHILISSSGVTQETPNSNVSIQEYSDGWHRVSLTYTADGTQSSFIQIFGDIDVTNSFYIFGAQVEEQPNATSYIKTDGAIATRLRDLVTMAGDLSTFNTDEGVLFAEVTEITSFPSNNYISLNIGGSAGQQFNNSIALNFRDSDKRVKAEIRVNGSIVAQQDQNNLTLPIKAAVRYSASEMALYVNGALVKTTKVPTAWFPSGTLTQVDFDRGGGSFPFFGRSKGVRTYNTALTDAEMITLTS